MFLTSYVVIIFAWKITEKNKITIIYQECYYMKGWSMTALLT